MRIVCSFIVCFLGICLFRASASRKSDEIPVSYSVGCGHHNSSISAICDPDNLLKLTDRNRLDEYLNYINNRIGKDVVSIAVVDEIDLQGLDIFHSTETDSKIKFLRQYANQLFEHSVY